VTLWEAATRYIGGMAAWWTILMLCWLTATRQPQSRPVAKHPDYDAVIVCDEPVYDIGTVWVGPILKHTFTLRNEGTETGWVRVFYSLAGTLASCVFPIPPGGSVSVRIALSSTKFQGSFEKGISVKLLGRVPHDTCGHCGQAYDSDRHLRECGPVCREHWISDWCGLLPKM